MPAGKNIVLVSILIVILTMRLQRAYASTRCKRTALREGHRADYDLAVRGTASVAHQLIGRRDESVEELTRAITEARRVGISVLISGMESFISASCTIAYTSVGNRLEPPYYLLPPPHVICCFRSGSWSTEHFSHLSLPLASDISPEGTIPNTPMR